MSYRLRYQQHNLELLPGQFLIGRSTECQLSLDDPLVSRKHAMLTITGEGVSVEDMGSRNGVLVDGVKIEGRRLLRDGARITVGGQDMFLIETQRDRAATMSALPAALVTFVGGPTPEIPSLEHPIANPAHTPPQGTPIAPPGGDDASKKTDTFKLLGGVAEKAMAMGRAEEAERLLQALLFQVRDALRAQRAVDAMTLEQAGRFSARLAGATGKGSWFDYVIELYALEGKMMPAPVIDELFNAVRKVSGVSVANLRDYTNARQEQAADLNPNERFLLQRIEGLVRLAALK